MYSDPSYSFKFFLILLRRKKNTKEHNTKNERELSVVAIKTKRIKKSFAYVNEI